MIIPDPLSVFNDLISFEEKGSDIQVTSIKGTIVRYHASDLIYSIFK